MSRLSLDDPVVEWAIEVPESIAVFESHGIDYSCGGKSLRYACEQQSVVPEKILEELTQHRNDSTG